MPDREKIIKEFEDFVKSFSKRDDTYYKSLFNCVLALLKEQEAVKPEWFDGTPFCGNCGHRLEKKNRNTEIKCSTCRRLVKW